MPAANPFVRKSSQERKPDFLPQVSIYKTETYDSAIVEEAVRFHFDALELSRFIRAGQKIVVKPNLIMKRDPGDAVTTHPALVEAVIRRLQAMGVRDITIAESPGRPLRGTAAAKPVSNLRHDRGGPTHRRSSEF